MSTGESTPCVGHADLYDLALFDDDAPAEQRTAATHAAAGLCRGCPLAATCTDRVTVDSAPRELVLLPDNWIPPEREGVAVPEEKARRRWSAERRASAAMAVGRDYLRPAQRPQAWAAMAAELADAGQTVPQIAMGLCVSEDVVRALLATSGAVAV